MLLPIVVHHRLVSIVLEGPERLHLPGGDEYRLLEENPADSFVACWRRQRTVVVGVFTSSGWEQVLHLGTENNPGISFVDRETLP